jgi:hypothetical protein
MSKGIITLWRGAGKSRVREEKQVNEKRGLESTEKGDPERTEKCELEVMSVSLRCRPSVT